MKQLSELLPGVLAELGIEQAMKDARGSHMGAGARVEAMAEGGADRLSGAMDGTETETGKPLRLGTERHPAPPRVCSVLNLKGYGRCHAALSRAKVMPAPPASRLPQPG
jgi:hypothetical protein